MKKLTFGRLDVWSVELENFMNRQLEGLILLQTLENLTGAFFFDPQDDPKGRYSADDEHLFRMMQILGQKFLANMFCGARKGQTFFNPDGNNPLNFLTGLPLQDLSFVFGARLDIDPYSIAFGITIINTVDDIAELRAAAPFMGRCLHLNPEDRASAEHLLEDLWL